MENNVSTFNGKVVSILIAIVVAACVLVPICSEFGGDWGGLKVTLVMKETV